MLTLKNIKFIAQENGEKVILNDISFHFEAGKNYVITGANGCGKSTLAKIIMGILPANTGQIYLGNKEITGLNTTERARMGVGFAFQQPVRFKGLTARDLLEQASGGKITTAQACEYLSIVGLCAREYLDRELDNTLSGGELKRIEIASVLARGCPLNIFDEPEAGIDIWSFNNLVDIFKKSINKNCTNIIISHQEKLFASADEIILIADGKIAMHGTPAEVLPNIQGFGNCNKLRRKNG
ncbi:MAG: ABC transporter ATP-binding protein [Clostridia bacterium]|nr:ABC transporter ATP-binding protein [Clostridia bacterium]